MNQLEKHGKGIILMHDFKRHTAEALPELIRELKAGGYKVVHMVALLLGYVVSLVSGTPTRRISSRPRRKSRGASARCTWPPAPFRLMKFEVARVDIGREHADVALAQLS